MIREAAPRRTGGVPRSWAARSSSVLILTALAFDFTNGFHDTANAMATSIATRAMRPRVAVALSAALNVAGALISLKVATTISQGIVDASLNALLAALIGAIIWNLRHRVLRPALELDARAHRWSHRGGLGGRRRLAVKGSAVLGKEALIALAGGVGVLAADGFVVIGAVRSGQARREGRSGAALAGTSLAVAGGLVCLAAIVLGILAMTHKS